VFTATFSGTSGGADIERAAILINSNLRAVNGCEVEYQRTTNTLRLRDNLALTWIGPVAVGAGSLSNSQCTVNSAARTRSFSGATLTLNLSITFSSSFNGAKTVYMNVSDTANLVDGWKAASSYTVGTATPAVPANVSVSPASGSGTTQMFTAVYSDANGGADIALAHLLVNGSVSGTAACFVEFNRPGNTVRLMNDAGNTWLGPITPGSGSLSNSQCSLTGSGSGGSVSGNNLTVTYAITFKTNFSGSKNFIPAPY
jgi:trimeric autotransporter adhesin